MILKTAAKRTLTALGLEVRRTSYHDWTDTSQFIPLKQTLDAARHAGMSIGDYIDTRMNNIPGATQATIDGMDRLGVFNNEFELVVEIGPGSGRYLEKTLKHRRPQRYEIYETAQAWKQYLLETYDVIACPTDGSSLKHTADASADLVQAHKVFSGISMLLTMGYWREMVRVVKPGGYAVFDLLSETCLPPAAVDAWAQSGLKTGAYPTSIPRSTCVAYFTAHGFELSGSFEVPMRPATTEVLVFRRLAAKDH